MKEDHRRAELLLSGLSHFVRGEDSMSLWSNATPGQNAIPSLRPDQARLSVGSLASLPTPSAPRPAATNVSAKDPITLSTDTSTVSTPGTTNVFSDADDDLPKASPATSLSDQIDVGFDPLPMGDQLVDEPSEDPSRSSINVRETFSRASNLIREAMDLAATVFLEVPHNDRFKDPKSRRPKLESRAPPSADSLSTSTSDSGSLTDTPDASSRKHGSKTGDDSDTEVLCHRLGYATKLKSSLVGSTITKPFLNVPVTMLSRLALRYPHGHIFHFDAHGSISSGDDSETVTSATTQRSSRSKKLSSRLHSMFPDARSLIFLPLYDNDKQQIYAGFIGVTTSISRALQNHESTYVSAFVNSLMCEVMRLEALKTDKAKSDFISSISHELRSPLHGVLASSQLLAESNLRPSQVEFVQMVDTCARTLLDIVDHLLDHAKINKFTQQQTHRRDSTITQRGPQSKPYSLVTNTSMLSTIEETVASMAAGTNQMLQNAGARRSLPGPAKLLTVPIVLDILPQEQWNFDTEVGSWRRIVMNLVGNSLKYTQQGHITVAFRLRKQSDTDFLAELTIADSGQGISKEYLQHRLYTPFAQEDNLSVGAGLGLSLVHQIVSSLHGDMEISSEVGTGTEVSVKVPLRVSQEAKKQQPQDLGDADFLKAIKQETFTFAGFDEQPSLSEEPTGIPSAHMKTLSALKSSFSNLLTDWFDAQVVDKTGNITIVEESFLQDNLTELDRPDRTLLVVGIDGRRTTSTDNIQHAAHVYVVPSIGPTRMASVLKLLLHERSQPRSTTPEVDARPHLSKELPASSIPESITSEPSTPASPQIKEAILLVDDNDINLRILLTCIQRSKLKDVELLTAANGKQAVEQYEAAVDAGIKISVVFMDLSMPIMNGFQATRKILALEKDRKMAREESANIMALTGLASEEALDEVRASGFDSYLRKPVTVKTIREVLFEARGK